MQITDNFLPIKTFTQLRKYVASTDSQIITVGDKQLSIIHTPNFLQEFLHKQNYNLILSFLRESYDGFDKELNIHADNRLLGKKVALASVLYINPDNKVTKNGTAFYESTIYGKEMPSGLDDNFHNNFLTKTRNNMDFWKKYQEVENQPNRMLTYNGNLFHGKYPANIDKGLRVVLVCFYESNIPDPEVALQECENCEQKFKAENEEEKQCLDCYKLLNQ
jgi:phosphopantetheine adenylyltransferase